MSEAAQATIAAMRHVCRWHRRVAVALMQLRGAVGGVGHVCREALFVGIGYNAVEVAVGKLACLFGGYIYIIVHKWILNGLS